MVLPKIPLGQWVDSLIEFLRFHFSTFFKSISEGLGDVLSLINSLLLLVHPLVFILILVALVWYISTKQAVIIAGLGLTLLWNLGLWEATIQTLILVLTATVIAIIIGLPIGILSAKNEIAYRIVMPILDLMQTMPAFVYLIPAVFFFRIGDVPGIIATIIFAIPPAIRLTSLGIRQVPEELVEASEAFGSTSMQKLLKVQLPLALPTIMAGVNQCIMLSLSMVVIAAMIGAGGLGSIVLTGIQRLDVGSAFEAGIGIVIIAVILDRVTQSLGTSKQN